MNGRLSQILNIHQSSNNLLDAETNTLRLALRAQELDRRVAALEAKKSDRLPIIIALITAFSVIMAGAAPTLTEEIFQDSPAMVEYNCIDEVSKALTQYREFPGLADVDFTGRAQEQCHINEVLDAEVARRDNQLQLPPGS